MNPSPAEKIADRLERIERENRILRWVGSAMFVGLLVVMATLMGPSGRRALDAESLELRDRQGVVRARLGLDRDGFPKLAFLDPRGMDQMVLSSVDNASGMELYDRGQLRVSMSAGPDGSSTLHLFDRARNVSSSFYMWADGTTGVLLNGGETPLHLTAKSGGESKLSVYDRDFVERGALRFPMDGPIQWMPATQSSISRTQNAGGDPSEETTKATLGSSSTRGRATL